MDLIPRSATLCSSSSGGGGGSPTSLDSQQGPSQRASISSGGSLFPKLCIGCLSSTSDLRSGLEIGKDYF